MKDSLLLNEAATRIADMCDPECGAAEEAEKNDWLAEMAKAGNAFSELCHQIVNDDAKEDELIDALGDCLFACSQHYSQLGAKAGIRFMIDAIRGT